MGEYRRICKSNKVLYGQLEALSHEINFCKANHTAHDIDLLTEARDSVKRQIDINLDMLERHWKMQGTTARMRQADEAILMPNKQELAIIGSFNKNPDLTITGVANESKSTPAIARAVITKFLNKRYIGI